MLQLPIVSFAAIPILLEPENDYMLEPENFTPE